MPFSSYPSLELLYPKFMVHGFLMDPHFNFQKSDPTDFVPYSVKRPELKR